VSLPAASAFSLSAAAEGRFAASGSLTFASARLARLAGLSVLDAADAPQRLQIDFAGLGPTDSAGLAVLLWRHLIVPGAAALLFLFPLWGILRPSAYTPMGVLLRQAVAGHPPVSW